MRMMHEAQVHPENSFITLTFSDEHLPENYSISKRDWQLFMKRLRFELRSKKIRFYMCGEYGDENLRPHYHAILFNHDFSDKKIFSIKNNNKIYTSEFLSKVWPFGHSTIGDVTFQSAAYVSRYTLKKRGGDLAADYYKRRNPLTGVVHQVVPEFSLMSRRPGIGSGWFEKFRDDVFPSGFLIAEGKKVSPPRFYVQKLTQEEQELLKRRARAMALPYKPHRTTERRRARAAVRDARISQLKRTLGDGNDA